MASQAGISATDTSALIAGQMQALAIQQQASWQPGQAQWAGLVPATSMSGQPFDPFNAGMANAAGSAAVGVANIAPAMAGVAGIAAMMQNAPAWADPFTGSFRAGRYASASGGLAGGIVTGGLMFGAYSAVGAGIDYTMLDPMRTGARMMGDTLGFAAQLAPQSSIQSLTPFAHQMLDMARIPLAAGMLPASQPELKMLAMQGMQSGQMSMSNGMGQFQNQFQGFMIAGHRHRPWPPV